MAKPLARDGAIPLLEEGVHLLRRAPLAAFVCHLIGTAPLALGLLLFWNDATNPRTPDATCAVESMVLTLLLTWMNCWRAVFAGRLRRLLSGTPDTPWTWPRIWRLLAGQAFLGATKLVVLPVAALIVFPLAWVVSFYRSATALADREDLDPAQLIASARQLAGYQMAQSWAILPILFFLQLLVTVNLALTLGVLPQLVRIVTGYESQFSRSGLYFIFSPLFLWSVLAVSWIAFDPFVQAVYCVRSFHGESVRTGEDLRAALRVLVTAGVLLVALLLPLHSVAAVSPHDLEQSVQQAMQSHEYDWRLPPSTTNQRVPWLVRITDRVVDGLRAVGQSIRHFFGSIWDWLKKLFGSQPAPTAGALPAVGMHWSITVLILAVALFTAWLVWRRRSLRRQRPKPIPSVTLEAVRLDAEDLSADRLPEESWLELAARSLEEGNFRFALRAYYLANLAWLGRIGYLMINAGKTNREYELELRRKARAFAESSRLFASNVAAVERVWYGLHGAAAADVDEFRTRMQEMKSILDAPREVAA